ncbi:hypothetical protein NJB18001_50940 [Mycobacterium marinum]|nr:hypothetical protein NJB18001_50940 [Mycobacterium marinum]
MAQVRQLAPSIMAMPREKPAQQTVASQRGYGCGRWVNSSMASCASSTVTPPAVISWTSRSSSASRVKLVERVRTERTMVTGALSAVGRADTMIVVTVMSTTQSVI